MAQAIYTKRLLNLLSGNSSEKTPYAPFYYHYPTLRAYRKLTKTAYYSILSQMEKRGSVEIIKRNGERFIKITAKGELEKLIEKAKNPLNGKWDGKWRLVLFDIPIAANNSRDKLRRLLKSNNFYKLQASVFISPHPLNREAISYLKKTGLIDFIRILRVDEFDDEKKIRKYFKL